MVKLLKMIEGVSKGPQGEDSYFFRVGNDTHIGLEQLDKYKRFYHKVTKITLTDDLPGLHCNLRQVNIYVGEHLIAQMPYHNIEIIEYITKGTK